jgi:hypothetical protein
MHKKLARYLMKRKDIDLWLSCLQEESEHKQYLIEMVTASISESDSEDEIKICVQAFINSALEGELIEILDKIVVHGKTFDHNGTLQNLLI